MLLRMSFTPANVDDDYFVDAATGDLSEGIELEANDTPDGLAHQLSFVASDDIAAAEFVVTGRDADDNVITETVTGVTTSPVETTKFFKRVDSIESDDDISSETVDVGFVDEVVSPTIRLNWRVNAPSHWYWQESGTLEADVQFTVADPGRYSDQESVPWALIVSDLDDVQNAEYWPAPAGLVAARVKFNSYSNGATATIYASQAELPA